MTEAVGYLTLSYHANAIIKMVVIVFVFILIAFIAAFPFVMEDILPSTKKTFFKYVSIISLTLILTATSVSWHYQTKAVESCAKDPNCDYIKANKAARDIINPDTLVFTQQQ